MEFSNYIVVVIKFEREKIFISSVNSDINKYSTNYMTLMSEIVDKGHPPLSNNIINNSMY